LKISRKKTVEAKKKKIHKNKGQKKGKNKIQPDAITLHNNGGTSLKRRNFCKKGREEVWRVQSGLNPRRSLEVILEEGTTVCGYRKRQEGVFAENM